MNANPARRQNWISRNGWQTLNATLLTVIGSLVLWLITITNQRLDAMHSLVDTNTIDINDLENVCKNLVETYNGKREVDDEQNRQILELWKSQRRSGNNENSFVIK